MIATRDHHFETTYLTPTDGSQDAEGLESWGLLHSKALIKVEKSREELKSSAAGERKGAMLKSSLSSRLLVSLVSLAMRTHGNEAPACTIVSLFALCLSYNLLSVLYLDMSIHSAKEWRRYILTKGVFGNALKFSRSCG